MIDQERIYSYPTGTYILLFVGAIAFGGASVLILGGNSTKDLVALIFFVPISLLSLYLAISFSSYKVIISEYNVSTHWFGRKRTLLLGEIQKVESNGNQIVLYAGYEKVSISSQVNGYVEIVEFLTCKRPDLWNMNESVIFHQNKTGLVILAMISVSLIALGSKGVLQGGEEQLASFVLACFGVLTLCMLANGMKTITVKKGEIILEYFMRKRTILVNDVKEISLINYETGNAGVTHPVIVLLNNNQKIQLSGVKEGTPSLYATLKTWLQQKDNA